MKTILSIALIGFTLTGFTQNKKEVKEADKLFKKEAYEEALPMYKKFITIDPTNVDYVYKYGACAVMVTDQTKEALKYLLKAKEYGKTDQEVAYFIGRAYEKNNDHQKALEYYERFKSAASKEEVKKLKVKKRIRACKKALK